MNKHWTKELLELLATFYSDSEWSYLEEILYPFKKDEIIHKAYKLNIKRNNYYWTIEQIEYLKLNYNNFTNKELSKKLNKTEASVGTKARKLGLLRSQAWTEYEIEIIKEHYSNKLNFQIAKLINRKPSCIGNKARELGLKKEKFARYDAELFIQNLKLYAEELKRTPLVSEIIEQSWSLSAASINRAFGGYRNACKLADLEINLNCFGSKHYMYKSKNQDLCWSKAEVIITNFFIDNNIKYSREEYYRNYISDPRCNTKTCDWIISNNVFVEYFGMMDKDFYSEKANVKISICSDNNIKLISLTEKDLTKLHSVFKNFIQH